MTADGALWELVFFAFGMALCLWLFMDWGD